MRMRRMKNLDSRMDKCADLRIAEPAALKGNWRSLKPDATALWVEVGCGKGKFTAETAEANPDVLLIAVERCREAMVVAMEKAKTIKPREILQNVDFSGMISSPAPDAPNWPAIVSTTPATTNRRLLTNILLPACSTRKASASVPSIRHTKLPS